MPIQSCQHNAKLGYKWGQTGKCYIYNPKSDISKRNARNKARKQGIAEIIKNFEMSVYFASKRISFDYDGVISTDKGKELIKQKIAQGNDVFIITARLESGNNDSLFNVAKELGIKKDNIYFTNHKDKWETIQRLNIDEHYDNNPEQIKKINENTKAKGILWQ